MFPQIDLGLKFDYKLKLQTPYKKTISNLKTAYDITYSAKLGGIDELEFKVPLYDFDSEFQQIRNPNWDDIKGDYLVKLKNTFNNEEKYFIVNTIKNDSQDKEIKTVQCLSLEYEINTKLVRNYKVYSRKLYDVLNTVDENGIQLGVMNYISTLTGWTIDSNISGDLMTKYRGFDISEKSALAFLQQDVQKLFDCVCLFDTINRKIIIKKADEIGGFRGLYLSDKNYIKGFSEDIRNTEEIVTRLYIYADKDMGVNSANLTGQPYIDDLSYFRNNEYMSQGLLTGLDNYDIVYNTQNSLFQTYLTNLETKQNLLLTKQNDLVTLQGELKIIEDSISSKIAQNQTYTTEYNNKVAKQSQITSKQSEITIIENDITTINNNINSTGNILRIENFLTTEQIHELNYFIRTKSWQETDKSYSPVAKEDWNSIQQSTQEDVYRRNIAKEMISEGRLKLQKISQPKIQFSLSLVDFLQCVTEQGNWGLVKLGDIVKVRFEKFNRIFELRIVAFKHIKDDLSIEFSNRDRYDNADIYLKDILTNAINSSTTVSQSFNILNNAVNDSNTLYNYINSDLDLASQGIKNSRNQDVQLNEQGFKIIDRLNNLKQLGMFSGCIAFTTNGWQTADTAITPNGVVARALYGNIIAGNNLTISNAAGNFLVNETGVIISDMNLTVTKADNKSRIKINATDGIVLQRNDGTWTNLFYADTNGNLTIDSILKARDIQDLNGNSFMSADKLSLNGAKIQAGSITADKIQTNQLVVGTNVGLGSAVSSSGVTTIIGNTVTTGYVNALGIKAGSVDAENITGTTITGKTINGGLFRTAMSGARIEIGSNRISSYNDAGQLNGLVTNMVSGSNYGDVYLYNNGSRALEFYNTITGGYNIRPVNGYNLFIGNTNHTVYADGDWVFTGNVTGADGGYAKFA